MHVSSISNNTHIISLLYYMEYYMRSPSHIILHLRFFSYTFFKLTDFMYLDSNIIAVQFTVWANLRVQADKQINRMRVLVVYRLYHRNWKKSEPSLWAFCWYLFGIVRNRMLYEIGLVWSSWAILIF